MLASCSLKETADGGTKFRARSDLLIASRSIYSLLTPSGEASPALKPIPDLSNAATVSLRSCVCCTCLAQSDFSPGDISFLLVSSFTLTMEPLNDLIT